jgi:hypothetical protein
MSDFFVTADDLIANRCYFMISFFDSDLKIPDIKTVIYLGVDVFNEGGNDHFFQLYEEHLETPAIESMTDIIAADSSNLMNFYTLAGLVRVLTDLSRPPSE